MKKKTSIIILVFILVSTFSFIPIAYSWFTSEDDSTFVIETGDFQVKIIASFGTTVITKESPYYDSAKETIKIDASNPTSPNYIGKFKVSIQIISDITARFRIKIQDEWRLVRTYRQSGLVIEEVLSHTGEQLNPISATYPFNISFSSKNDLNSGYMYYNSLIEKNQNYVINFINGGKPQPVKSNLTYYEQCYVYFDLIVDIVQANRFSVLWGIPENYFS